MSGKFTLTVADKLINEVAGKRGYLYLETAIFMRARESGIVWSCGLVASRQDVV